MLFNSFQFLIFLPCVVSLFFLLPVRIRPYMLLGASYVFYMCWRPEYAILLVISTLVDFFSGKMMARHSKRARRVKYLVLSLATNLGLLFAFKYYDFFERSLFAITEIFGWGLHFPELNVLLPVGISFYTFQTLSYTIDIFRNKMEPETNIFKFALYVSFFPQLVAGPIERPANLLPQLDCKSRFDYDLAVEGLRLVLWGLFKKVVVADRLAQVVDNVYSAPENFSSIELIIATVAFAFQIYYDFSAYSDIAIGSARIIGIDLMQNFNRPYASQSIKEFWQRWHISLSTWFRDYVYIPLGGNRVTQYRRLVNVFVVFLVSGLWHGASWTFVVWGAIHGLYMVTEILLSPVKEQLLRVKRLSQSKYIVKFCRIFTTFILVNIAWVFFRADSFPDAFEVFKGVVFRCDVLQYANAASCVELIHRVFFSTANMCIIIFMVIFIEVMSLVDRRHGMKRMFIRFPLLIRWSIYVFLILAIMNLGVVKKEAFIYFQF